MREKEIRPSKASVWVRCPASSSGLPVTEDPESEEDHGRNGRLAHWLAERLYRFGEDPQEGNYSENADGSFLFDEGGSAHIGAQMVSSLYDYVEHIRSLPGEGFIEKKLEFLPGRWGTADFLVLGGDFTAHVVDLKTGFKFVNARENFQLMSYLCGAVKDIKDDDQFMLTIFQPRAYGYPVIRDYSLGGVELKRFRTRLAEAAALAEEGTARPEAYPEACASCDRAVGCRALSSKLAEIRDSSFSGDPVRVAALLDWKPAVYKLFDKLEEEASRLLLDGQDVPGYTMEHRRGVSRFSEGVSDDDLLAFAKEHDVPLTPEDINKTTVKVDRISPAALKSLIKGKGSSGKKKALDKLTYYCPGSPTVKKTVEVYHEYSDESELF